VKHIYKFSAMSTPCELILYESQKTKADSVAESVLVEVKRLEKKYNYYNKDSFLSLINSRSESNLDKETKTLLQRAKQYYALTNGIFDVTVATFKDLYRSETSLDLLKEKKEKLLGFVGCEHFEVKKDKIFFDNEFTKIDLGGFVKEYAVDRSAQLIKKAKIKSALVNYGGDIYALGKKPDGTRFKVGIKNPQNTSEHARYAEIENQALTTSASYERNYTIEEEVFSHIFSKQDANNSPKSVTVISSNCVESGVYSTALMIEPQLKHNNQTIVMD